MINLEDLMEQKIINELKYLYSMEDDKLILVLFFIRCYCYFGKNNLEDKDYMDFLKTELNLPDKIIFNGIKFSELPYTENSLNTIVNNFKFEITKAKVNDLQKGTIKAKDYIQDKFNFYKDFAINKLKKRKQKKLLSYIMINQINLDFNIELKNNRLIEGIHYPDSFNINRNALNLEANINYNEYLLKHQKASEDDLEKYIYNQKEFFGVKITERQKRIPDGIIDLFGYRGDIPVIIELKITNKPKDLLWQIVTYKKNISVISGKDPDVIVVAPKLNKNILDILPEYTEIYEYKKEKNKYKFICIKK